MNETMTGQPGVQRARVESLSRRESRPDVGPAPLDEALPERGRDRGPTPPPTHLCGDAADGAHIEERHDCCEHVICVGKARRLVDSSAGSSVPILCLHLCSQGAAI